MDDGFMSERVRANAAHRRAYRKLRARVFEVLGGPRCRRCGFTDDRALHFDHIDGGGSRHRRQRGVRGSWRDMLIRPERYQVLCANCNLIKRSEDSRKQAS
jgi:hypothetical protein